MTYQNSNQSVFYALTPLRKMMPNQALFSLKDNAVKYFQNKYTGISFLESGIFFYRKSINYPYHISQHEEAYILNAIDFDSGVLYRVLVTNDTNIIYEVTHHDITYQETVTVFKRQNKSMFYAIEDLINPSQSITNQQLSVSPKLFIYTNAPVPSMKDAKFKIEIIEESKMYHSVFISYGGPDETIASTLNDFLKKHGVKTFFFPKDKRGGEKLQRTMHKNINEHDKTIFLCSENSLNRNGVLHEIELALDTQARKGGTQMFVPVCLDNYLNNGWVPPAERPDMKEQLKAYTYLNFKRESEASTQQELEDILSALKK